MHDHRRLFGLGFFVRNVGDATGVCSKYVSKHRNRKAYLGRGEWGMELGEEGRTSAHGYTVTSRITPALRWAVMRATLINCEGQSHKTVSTDHNF